MSLAPRRPRACLCASLRLALASALSFIACREAPDTRARATAIDAASDVPLAVAPTAPSSAAPDATAGTAAHVDASPASQRVGCRVLGVSGKVTAVLEERGLGDRAHDGRTATLGAAMEVPPLAWIDLAQGARLETKDARTGRELAFEAVDESVGTTRGAARVQPCRPGGAGDAEEAWIARGSAASGPGGGEVPGQEQWLVTPLAVVRYSAAMLKVVASEVGLSARVTGGSAWVWIAGGVKVTGADAGAEEKSGAEWRRLDRGEEISLGAASSALTEGGAREAVAACASAASHARDLARGIGAPGARVAELAPEHVTARQLARAACAVAWLRASLVPAGAARRALDAKLTGAADAWRAVPGRTP